MSHRGPLHLRLVAGSIPPPPPLLVGRRAASKGAVAGVPVSSVAYRLFIAVGVVALMASAASFFIPDVLSGPAVAQGNVRGTALA